MYSRNFGGRWLKPSIDKDGYHHVTLQYKGKKSKRRVSRLVLEAYVGESTPGAKLALHNNGDVSDNSLGNLRWGSNSDNMRDRVRHGTCRNSNVTECPKGHPYTPENTGYGSNGVSRVCRTCRRNEKAQQRLQGLAPGDPRHGTSNGWFNWGCRCSPCNKAHEVYRQKRKESK